MITKYNYNTNFINILIKCIDEKKLYSIYKLDNKTKYTIDYILDILISVSKFINNRYSFPVELNIHLNTSNYALHAKKSIKQFIKKQIIDIDNDNFLKTYIVIGYNYPITINELTVVI